MSDTAFVPVAPEVRSNQTTEKHQQHQGPLKEIIAQQDSLYKYISWEDPVRSLGTYLGALGLLCGAHYLPLTQLALKAIAITLGAVAATEFASKSFTSNTVLARLRPKEYKKVPEGILNDTLHDIHDFIQYAVVKSQKILMGEDLQQTTIAFALSASLFWLIKVLNPFGLAILGLTALYTAPLIASPQGRQIADNARVRAGELTNAAVENGKVLAQDGKEKAAQLSSQAQETVLGASQAVGGAAKSGQQTVTNAATNAQSTVSNVTSSAVDSVTSSLPKTAQNPLNSVLGSKGSGQTTSSRPQAEEFGLSDSTHYHASATDHLQHPVTVVSGQPRTSGTGQRTDAAAPRNRHGNDPAPLGNIMDRSRGVGLPENLL